MRIYSNDQRSWISTESQKDEHGYSAFSVEAVIDVVHGTFEARNIDVQWLNLAEFVADLGRFVEDRSLRPKLDGTYDSLIRLSGTDRTVDVEFAIGDAYVATRTHDYLLTGTFEVDEDRLLDLVKSFEALRDEHFA